MKKFKQDNKLLFLLFILYYKTNKTLILFMKCLLNSCKLHTYLYLIVCFALLLHPCKFT